MRRAWRYSTRRGEMPFDRAVLMASLCSVRIISGPQQATPDGADAECRARTPG